ncbi:speckle-type POZ protein-like [Microplitis mediator]|uniref:speckle-type POZ protein-like n=1 Tax=Microplitis mediator TaxID=375433 RepID=UPI0025560E9F|nr:speckle-type POZ protein-like [Microplitis mediator]XP_057340011.1 speckle-type POZ protein-like [Microplitis mediator]
MEAGYTLVKRNTVTYEWQIQEISSFLEASNTSDKAMVLQSSKFSTRAKIQDFWNLQVQLYDTKSENKDKVGLYLNSLNGNSEVKTEYSLFILNNEKKQVNKKKLIKTFGVHTSWGLSQFITKEDLLKKKDELLPYDILTIGIELTVFDDPVVISTNVPFNESKAFMAHDYEKFYESKMGSDVELIVQEKKFPAHKFVLMVRSPVFQAMLTTDMRENREKAITIKDMNSEVFKSMLEFIYTDKISDLDDVAEQLLEAADKYQIPTLKEICAESLCKSVTIDNASRLLVVAYLHNAKEMLEYISNFIVINAIHVVKTEEYKMMKKLHPSLGCILFDKLAASFENK